VTPEPAAAAAAAAAALVLSSRLARRRLLPRQQDAVRECRCRQTNLIQEMILTACRNVLGLGTPATARAERVCLSAIAFGVTAAAVGPGTERGLDYTVGQMS
jgi:hypothetical protein